MAFVSPGGRRSGRVRESAPGVRRACVLLLSSLATASPLVIQAQAPAQAAQPAPGTATAQPVIPAPAAPSPHPVSQHHRDQAQQAFTEGAKDIERKDMRAAFQHFSKAAALDPDNANYNQAVIIARQNLATQIVQAAEKAKMLGREEEWRAGLREAVLLDAHNPMVAQHMNELTDESSMPPEAVFGADTSQAAPPLVLAPTDSPHSFHLYAARTQVIQQVLSAYGIVPSVDKSVPGDRVRFDQDDVSFAEARLALTLATGTFLVPLDPKRVLVAKDTKENRSQYERLAMETIYLPGLTSAEMSDIGNIARNVFEAQQATVTESTGTLEVRAPQFKLAALNQTLSELLDGRSQVLLDVHMYEVSSDRTVSEGAELPSSSNVFNVTSEVQSLISANPSLVQQIISSGLVTPGNFEEIAAALVLSGQAGSTLLSQGFAYFGGGITTTGVTLSQSAANLSLSASDTRLIDNMQLRLNDQEEGTLKVGERYPIVTSSYSNLATGSTSIAGITSAGLSNTLASLGVNLASLSASANSTVPQVQYQDIGLTLRATPRIEQTRDVSIKLDLQFSSLSGQTLNSNPIINNRQFQSLVSLKPGEKALIVSSLSNQETATVIGLPFISEIPGLQSATNKATDHMRDSLVIVITPRVVRLSHKISTSTMILLPQHS